MCNIIFLGRLFFPFKKQFTGKQEGVTFPAKAIPQQYIQSWYRKTHMGVYHRTMSRHTVGNGSIGAFGPWCSRSGCPVCRTCGVPRAWEAGRWRFLLQSGLFHRMCLEGGDRRHTRAAWMDKSYVMLLTVHHWDERGGEREPMWCQHWRRERGIFHSFHPTNNIEAIPSSLRSQPTCLSTPIIGVFPQKQGFGACKEIDIWLYAPAPRAEPSRSNVCDSFHC